MPICRSPSVCLARQASLRPCGQTGKSRRGRHQRAVPERSEPPVWTSPNEGAVKVANTAGCDATDSGTPLPPRSPAAIRW